MDNETQVICKHRTGIGGVLLAFLTGASVATTVILMVHKAREAVSPSADQLLKRCDRAAEALDSRIPQTATS